MIDAVAAKGAALDDLLAGLGCVVLAYSGGVDSSLLAHAAHEVLGERALAVTAVSPSLARRDLDAARDLAQARGWNHRVVTSREVAREEYARNDPQRCYWCKTELFEVLGPLARALGATLAVGTNLDDLSEHRPGLVAAAEHDVRAPLAEARLTKADVRALARAAGLPTADRPAQPCLSSRVAYGVRVTPQRLRRIDAAEELLRSLGFTELRVRDHGDVARVEVPPDRIAEVVAHRDVIESELRALGWRYVTVDLTGFRSGSLNEVLAPPTLRRAGDHG